MKRKEKGQQKRQQEAKAVKELIKSLRKPFKPAAAFMDVHMRQANDTH